MGLINDGDGLRASCVGFLIFVTVRVKERLFAVQASLGDLRENLLQLSRRLALDIALLDDDAELRLVGQINHARSHGLFEFVLTLEQDVVHVEICGGEEQGVVEQICDCLRGVCEIEDVAYRVVNVVAQRGAGVDDVAIGGENVAVNRGVERAAGGQFLAAQFLFGRGEIPADGGLDYLLLRDGNLHDLVNWIRQRPVQPGVEQGFLAFADGLAEAEDDGLFLRADGEKSRAEKHQHHERHDDFDNRKAAAQRLGQRLRTGVLHFRRGRFVVVMIVFVAHEIYFAGKFFGRFWNKSNGGVRSSKIKVDFWLSEALSASIRNR